MSDDIFFREVNEEIRQERTRVLWARFGAWVIGAAVLAVVATGAYVGWTAYRERQANASGDRYLAALDLATSNKNDEAVKALEELGSDGFGAYPDLARLRIATIREATGDGPAAVAAFDAVANDAKAPRPLRDIAAVRAAYILVDTGTRDDVRARVERLSGDAEPLRHPARETLGLAAWKAGAADDAKGFFSSLIDDQSTPQGIASRAQLMLEVIASGAKAEASPAPDATVAKPPAAIEPPSPPVAAPPVPAKAVPPS